VTGEFDLVVVGAGACGAFAAWDAALRGLRVALIDRGDFGGATSANSLKIVHGGLRYLQQANLPRMRESVRERAILLRAAPHLVRPLPCLFPTTGHGTRSRAALAAALALNDAISFDRNQSREPSRQLPRGRTVGRDEFHGLAGPLGVAHASGGALWYDGFIESPERLLLAVVRSAEAAGAVVANYVAATALVRERGRVAGVRTRAGEGTEGELRARVVLNAAGPWARHLTPDGRARAAMPALVRACNVVVRRAGPAVAVAVPSAGEQRMLFAVPWRGHLVLGTSYRVAAAPEPAAGVAATEQDVEGLLADFNGALPGLALRRDEVTLAHAGLLPGVARRGDAGGAKGAATPLDRAVLLDHAALDALPGLVTVQTVKWTTARAVAERAVNVCQRQLGASPRPGGTDHASLVGSPASLEALWAEPPVARVPPALARRLKELYGTEHHAVLALAAARPALAEPLAPGCDVIGAQVVHAIRVERAQRLADVVLRRTELGTLGDPGEPALAAAARVAADEAAWPVDRSLAEARQTRDAYAVAPG
jgi:glycerol-3-phosphate dehydrogenase